MLLNGGGWGPGVGIAVQLREHGYLSERRERQGTEGTDLPRGRRGSRGGARVLRLATACLALLVRAGFWARA